MEEQPDNKRNCDPPQQLNVKVTVKEWKWETASSLLSLSTQPQKVKQSLIKTDEKGRLAIGNSK